jgi:hypothetical protein
MNNIENDIEKIENEIKNVGSDVIEFETDGGDIENAAKKCTFARIRNVFALGIKLLSSFIRNSLSKNFYEVNVNGH